ncbi:MAG: histidine phosphatase family protein [Pseudomonadales bacterium]
MSNEGRLLFIRHGETPANIDKVWHGQIDTPLSATGQQQVKALGRHFHKVMRPDVIYASPLQRARITAESIAQAQGMAVDLQPDLMEFHIGEWENISYDRLHNEFGFFKSMMEDEHFCAPAGESRAEATQRFTTAVEKIAALHAGENVAIVAHGMVMSFALAHWLQDDTTKWLDYPMENTAITEFCLQPAALIALNQVDHLDA